MNRINRIPWDRIPMEENVTTKSANYGRLLAALEAVEKELSFRNPANLSSIAAEEIASAAEELRDPLICAKADKVRKYMIMHISVSKASSVATELRSILESRMAA